MGQSRKRYASPSTFSNFSFLRLTIFYLLLSRMFTNTRADIDEERMPTEPDLQNPCTYLSAIYDDESVSYLAPRKVTFYTNEMVERIITSNPNGFMSNFQNEIMPDHPFVLQPDPHSFPMFSFKNLDPNSHVSRIDGFSGSETAKITLGYMANLKSGYILALGASYKPVIKIKVDTAKLFNLFGEDADEVKKGEEIYYSYVDPKTLTLLTLSMGQKFENDLDDLDWSIETLKPSLGKEIEVTEWFHQTGETSKLHPLSFFSLANACKKNQQKNDETQLTQETHPLRSVTRQSMPNRK